MSAHLRHGTDYVIVDGEPVYAWDVLDDQDHELTDCIDEPYLDTEDLWTRDAIIAMLIVAFSDETQATDVPF
jgi:hypothetical protein